MIIKQYNQYVTHKLKLKYKCIITIIESIADVKDICIVDDIVIVVFSKKKYKLSCYWYFCALSPQETLEKNKTKAFNTLMFDKHIENIKKLLQASFWIPNESSLNSLKIHWKNGVFIDTNHHIICFDSVCFLRIYNNMFVFLMDYC